MQRSTRADQRVEVGPGTWNQVRTSRSLFPSAEHAAASPHPSLIPSPPPPSAPPATAPRRTQGLPRAINTPMNAGATPGSCRSNRHPSPSRPRCSARYAASRRHRTSSMYRGRSTVWRPCHASGSLGFDDEPVLACLGVRSTRGLFLHRDTSRTDSTPPPTCPWSRWHGSGATLPDPGPGGAAGCSHG